MDSGNNNQPNDGTQQDQAPQQPQYQQPQQPVYQQQPQQTGYQQQPMYQQQPGMQPENPKNNLATISLLLGLGTFAFALIAWIVSCAGSASAANSIFTTDYDALSGTYSVAAVLGFLGLACGIVAIVLSVTAKKTGKSGSATAGLVLGIIGVVLCVITTVSCACLCAGANEAAKDGYNVEDFSDWFD